MDRDSRIAELEGEVAALKAELAGCAAKAQAPHEDPAIARLLADRRLLSSLPDVILILDRAHRIVYLNRTVRGRIADFIGTNVLDQLPEDQRAARREALERAWETGEVQSVESRSFSGNSYESRLVPIKEHGRVAYMLTTSVEITERKRAEEALRESESRLRHAIEATGMGTWSSRNNGQELTWDDTLCKIYGMEPDARRRGFEVFLEYVHPEDRERFLGIIEGFRARGVYDDFEFRIVRPDGAIRHVLSKGSLAYDSTGTVTGSYGGIFDITERKLLEEQLNQVQKMEAIGQLTAGVAHNFNNVLGIILPNVELCLRSASPAIAARLADIAHAAERGAEMVRQLMLFARRDEAARKEPVDLAECAQRTADICRATFDRRIAFDLFVAKDLPCALANAGQIEQVLLNVCLNARDALEEAGSPAPRIALRLEPGRPGMLRMRVSDNGPGMDEATRAHVFEPFFTTKNVDRGTGLGLASAYAIVAAHRGRIACESRFGEGTTFEIELPTTDQRPPEPAADEPAAALGGSETVLLIEDEPLVRAAVRDLLELGGYRVLEACDGVEGIATFERERPEVDAVIVDRSMPGLSGEQVLDRLVEIAPEIPVVILSGHPGRADRLPRASAVLAKPTSYDTLLRTIRAVLDRSPVPSR